MQAFFLPAIDFTLGGLLAALLFVNIFWLAAFFYWAYQITNGISDLTEQIDRALDKRRSDGAHAIGFITYPERDESED
jgi:hypothetical protein